MTLIKKIQKIGKICHNITHHFQGECSISEDIKGKNIKLIRIGITDDDVAQYPKKIWIQLYLNNKVYLSFPCENVEFGTHEN